MQVPHENFHAWEVFARILRFSSLMSGYEAVPTLARAGLFPDEIDDGHPVTAGIGRAALRAHRWTGGGGAAGPP